MDILIPHTASEHKAIEKVNLNLKQRKLVSVLSFNSRAAPLEIGRIIGTSKDTVRYNLKKLGESGVIPRNTIIINPYAFGLKFNTIFLKVKNLDMKKETALIKFIIEHPFVGWCGLVGGEWDFGIHIFSKNIDHFNKISKEIKRKAGSELIDSITLDIYGFEKYDCLPEAYRDDNGISRSNILKNSRSYFKEPCAGEADIIAKLDKLEISILSELVENPDASLANLADKLKVSFGNIKKRFNGLVDKKVILAFHPLINLTSLGLISRAILIETKTVDGNDKIREYLKNNPNICYVMKTHGDWDWEIYTATSSQHEFYSILRSLRSELARYVQNTSVMSIIQDYKFDFAPSGIREMLKELI